MPRGATRTNRRTRARRHPRLRYVETTEPGIRRTGSGESFRYVYSTGRPVRDPAVLRRIQSLAIPPAWSNVWICRDPLGHVQATGKDDRGRKQYRYHDGWRQVRDEAKYERTISFAQKLPRIRRCVARHLRLKQLSREKVLAAVVKLLETTLIRVGNEEYASQNGSYGLTTMHNKHARVNGQRVCFKFPGKSGIRHEVDLADPRLAKIVRRCQQLPGQQLFQYVDDAGQIRGVTSSDVNDYLKRISGEEFTAKDFRTWAGTALAAEALQQFEDFDSTAAAKRNVTQAVEKVAQRLGNTKAICRKCYVHPAVIDAYLDRSLVSQLKIRAESTIKRSGSSLPPEEAAVLALLQQRMERQASPNGRRIKKRARSARKRRDVPAL
jgi:DNA topoisomerase-1